MFYIILLNKFLEHSVEMSGGSYNEDTAISWDIVCNKDNLGRNCLVLNEDYRLISSHKLLI